MSFPISLSQTDTFAFSSQERKLSSQMHIIRNQINCLQVKNQLPLKASVSPTVIQKLRNSESAERITFRTFISVIRSLGYKMRLEKL